MEENIFEKKESFEHETTEEKNNKYSADVWFVEGEEQLAPVVKKPRQQINAEPNPIEHKPAKPVSGGPNPVQPIFPIPSAHAAPVQIAEPDGEPRSPRWRRAVAIALLIVLAVSLPAIVFGIYHYNSVSVSEEAATDDMIQQSTEQSVTFAEPTTVAPKPSAPKPSPLHQMATSLENVIEQAPLEMVSCCVLDMNSNDMVFYGNTDAQPVSSLVAIPILYAYAKEIDEGKINEKKLLSVSIDWTNRGILKQEDENAKYSIEVLFKYLFEASDNNAVNTLITYLGREYIEEICFNGGYDSVTVEKLIGSKEKDPLAGENAINVATTEDLARMLKELLLTSDFARKILNNYFRAPVADKYGKIGIAGKMNGTYGSLNGYTEYLYNEIMRVETGSGNHFIVVYFSRDTIYKHGSATAKEVGKVLSAYLE